MCKFKSIDLNEANKIANNTKLTTKKAENKIKKAKQDLQEIQTKIRKRQKKKIKKFLKKNQNFKEIHTKQWHISGLIKLLKYIIIQIIE